MSECSPKVGFTFALGPCVRFVPWSGTMILTAGEATTALLELEAAAIALRTYHQQADPVERSIQTAQTVLRCYQDTDWVSRLPYVELAMNDAKHDSTGWWRCGKNGEQILCSLRAEEKGSSSTAFERTFSRRRAI
jgi:hypothetical protein